MRKLLKADLFSARKNKLLIGGFISICVLTLFEALMYILLKVIMTSVPELEGDLAVVNLNFSGRTLMYNGLSASGDLAIIAPIFICIYAVRDFRGHTIRNKLMAGYTRTQIFFSLMITCAVVYLIYMVSAAFIQLLVGSLLFGFSNTINADVILTTVVVFLLYVLIHMSILTIELMLTINSQNIAVAICVPLGLSFLFGIISIVVSQNLTLANILSFTGYYQSTELSYADVFQDLGTNVLNPDVVLGPGIRTVISSIVYIVGFSYLGKIWFSNVEFK